MTNYITILFTNLLLVVSVNAQDFTLNIDTFSQNHIASIQSKLNTYSLNKPTNEVEFISLGLFSFYKEFISSQDDVSCNFHPSCSVFAIRSIQKKGPFTGILMAFDRLTRCNGLNRDDYEKYENMLLYDPVD